MFHAKYQRLEVPKDSRASSPDCDSGGGEQLSRPFELESLYDPISNATWSTKAADSLEDLPTEKWSGDNLGHQEHFAGAVCRTNFDVTPPRVVIKGALNITIEVHTKYVEYGASCWDPVDDLWYPQWRSWDRVNDTIDDGAVNITGADEVDFHNVGVYVLTLCYRVLLVHLLVIVLLTMTSSSIISA